MNVKKQPCSTCAGAKWSNFRQFVSISDIPTPSPERGTPNRAKISANFIHSLLAADVARSRLPSSLNRSEREKQWSWIFKKWKFATFFNRIHTESPTTAVSQSKLMFYFGVLGKGDERLIKSNLLNFLSHFLHTTWVFYFRMDENQDEAPRPLNVFSLFHQYLKYT